MFKQILTAQDVIARAEQESRLARIVELKRLLTESDYKVMPDYDHPNDDVLAQRQLWRQEIRHLQSLDV